MGKTGRIYLLFRGFHSVVLPDALLPGWVGGICRIGRHIARTCGRAIPSEMGLLAGCFWLYGRMAEIGYFCLCGSSFGSLLGPAGCAGCHIEAIEVSIEGCFEGRLFNHTILLPLQGNRHASHATSREVSLLCQAFQHSGIHAS